jgi:hypothetical protein
VSTRDIFMRPVHPTSAFASSQINRLKLDRRHLSNGARFNGLHLIENLPSRQCPPSRAFAFGRNSEDGLVQVEPEIASDIGQIRNVSLCQLGAEVMVVAIKRITTEAGKW